MHSNRWYESGADVQLLRFLYNIKFKLGYIIKKYIINLDTSHHFPLHAVSL